MSMKCSSQLANLTTLREIVGKAVFNMIITVSTVENHNEN